MREKDSRAGVQGVHSWIRQNVLGLVAIFIALSGTAVATNVTGHNTVKVVQAKKKVKAGPRGPAGPQGIQGPPGPSTGPAGGALAGSYPNPTISAGAVGTGAFGTIPAASLANNAVQSIPTGVVTSVAFSTATFDTDGLHTAPERLTAPVAGTYTIHGLVTFASAGTETGYRGIQLRVNGATAYGEDTEAPSGIQPDDLNATALVHLSAGDYVDLAAFQNSGGALDLLGAQPFTPTLSMAWIGP